MLITLLAPGGIWRHPNNDGVFIGFEPNLLSISERGFPLPNAGQVRVSATRDSLTLTAPPSSGPSVHLLTTSRQSFSAMLDIAVLKNPPGTTPLRLGVWSPRSSAGYFLSFGPAPRNLVTAELIEHGTPVQTLIRGDVTDSEQLGTYAVGETYHLEIAVNKESGVIAGHLSGTEGPPSGHRMLALTGGPARHSYGDIYSGYMPVVGGHAYNFGGLVRLVSGGPAFKLDVEWLNHHKDSLGFAGN